MPRTSTAFHPDDPHLASFLKAFPGYRGRYNYGRMIPSPRVNPDTRDLLILTLFLAGNQPALAAALITDSSTVRRWMRGETAPGPHYRATMRRMIELGRLDIL